MPYVRAVDSPTGELHSRPTDASATRVYELSDWKEASHLGTLAAASAEAGDFDAAVKWQEKALELMSERDDQEEGRRHLALYRARQPYHEEAPAR